MKIALFALVVAGCCLSVASAQTRFNRSCNTGTRVSYVGNGFAISYGTWSPRTVSWGRPVYGGRYCPPPVIVVPCGVPVRTRTVAFQPTRRVVANPVFPAQGYQWRR